MSEQIESMVAAAAPPYLAALNPAQRGAVEAIDGPVLVLAGAGTGKTRVLTTRLAHILATRRAFPGQLLAVTFTNKAAREMRERLEGTIGAAVDGIWLGTFHAIAARILRRHAERIGLKSNFTILDTDDQLRLVKQIIAAANIDDRRMPPRMLLSAFDRWKDRGLGPDKVPADEAAMVADGRGRELFREYEQRLVALNAVDFGDLLLHNLTLLTNHADVLADYHHRFRYILVDEYQDTNVAQYLWLRLLAQGHRNLCCVGDDDQSIYSWRGAEVGNILRFEKDFPGTKIVRLEQNYRSTPHILGAAAGLIARNEGRLGKTLWTESAEGERIVLRYLRDGIEEARWVGDEIEAMQRKGHALSDIAILVRAGWQTREFEERFITIGLPY
ncbi:MAG TPA: UvrD-helicase domain-containing protein, partial [Stellaceae bacterium]|nr:UvrD-helicase domain-containing protein [Stellaceae bacterium]